MKAYVVTQSFMSAVLGFNPAIVSHFMNDDSRLTAS